MTLPTVSALLSIQTEGRGNGEWTTRISFNVLFPKADECELSVP